MSTRDHPDWWKNIGGQNSQDSILERRSTVSNDNGIEDGTVPALSFHGDNYVGKFFSRGMRGKIERIEVYGSSVPLGTSFIRYSPHPCLGPINEIQINVGAPWAWYGVDVEEMWDYDSFFIWFRVMNANTRIGYDAEFPHDDHESGDAGATWASLANRMFIRIIYSSETPGDVPVSGIINNIPIPYTSTEQEHGFSFVTPAGVFNLITVDGIGYCDLVIVYVQAAAASHNTGIHILCDGVEAFTHTFINLNALGFGATTPSLTLPAYGVGALCTLVSTKRFEFRRSFEIEAVNGVGNVNVTAWAYPNLAR